MANGSIFLRTGFWVKTQFQLISCPRRQREPTNLDVLWNEHKSLECGLGV